MRALSVNSNQVQGSLRLADVAPVCQRLKCSVDWGETFLTVCLADIYLLSLGYACPAVLLSHFLALSKASVL